MSSNRAFTLLELLVVITIIGILSSIVIVSMSGSTDSATIAKGKAYAQQIHALLGANAVGVWNFDEGFKDTCPESKDACDISGYNNHGTFHGDTHFVPSDIGGYALSFDGAGDYVDCGDNNIFNVSSAITVEAWIKSSASSAYRTVISKGYYDDLSYSLRITRDTEPIKAFFSIKNIGDTKKRAGTYNNIANNQWFHLVGIYDSSQVCLYVNGILDGQCASLTGPIYTSALPVFIGKMSTFGTATEYFSGLIDDVRIYSEALASTEIQKHYAQGLERLLTNQAITKAEYNQRIEEFN